jgi:hypothetical protein
VKQSPYKSIYPSSLGFPATHPFNPHASWLLQSTECLACRRERKKENKLKTILLFKATVPLEIDYRELAKLRWDTFLSALNASRSLEQLMGLVAVLGYRLLLVVLAGGGLSSAFFLQREREGVGWRWGLSCVA